MFKRLKGFKQRKPENKEPTSEDILKFFKNEEKKDQIIDALNQTINAYLIIDYYANDSDRLIKIFRAVDILKGGDIVKNGEYNEVKKKEIFDTSNLDKFIVLFKIAYNLPLTDEEINIKDKLDDYIKELLVNSNKELLVNSNEELLVNSIKELLDKYIEDVIIKYENIYGPITYTQEAGNKKRKTRKTKNNRKRKSKRKTKQRKRKSKRKTKQTKRNKRTKKRTKRTKSKK